MSGRVVCIGGLVLDSRVRSLVGIIPATSNPAEVTRVPGGVAGNVAMGLAGLGVPVALVSAVGEDGAGRLLLDRAAAAGVDVSGVRVVAGAETAQYVAFLHPDGELYVAAAAMDVLGKISAHDARQAWPGGGEDWVFAEANLPAGVLAEVIGWARTTGVRLALDAVSVPKVARLPADLRGVAVLFGNLDEARALTGSSEVTPSQCATALRGRGVAASVFTLGADGALVQPGDDEPVRVPGVPVRVRDVTGAGDALIAATLAGLVRGEPLTHAVTAGVRAAAVVVAGHPRDGTAPQ